MCGREITGGDWRDGRHTECGRSSGVRVSVVGDRMGERVLCVQLLVLEGTLSHVEVGRTGRDGGVGGTCLREVEWIGRRRGRKRLTWPPSLRRWLLLLLLLGVVCVLHRLNQTMEEEGGEMCCWLVEIGRAHV